MKNEKNFENNKIYNNTGELISLYESEFSEYARQIQNMFTANEEMLKYDPKDYDFAIIDEVIAYDTEKED